jgi:hypothetical protein
VIRNLPTGPGGTVGRSQDTTPPSPEPSTMDSRNRAFRLSRSSLAMTSVARWGTTGRQRRRFSAIMPLKDRRKVGGVQQFADPGHLVPKQAIPALALQFVSALPVLKDA